MLTPVRENILPHKHEPAISIVVFDNDKSLFFFQFEQVVSQIFKQWCQSE